MATPRKAQYFENKVIIVDGFSGSGKTILPPIIDSFKNTLLPAFYYELEWLSALQTAGEISQGIHEEMIRQAVDLRFYNQSLGRETNLRVPDLSSAWRSSKVLEIIMRCMEKDDQNLYKLTSSRGRVLALTLTQQFRNTKSYLNALGSRVLMVEFIRDPLYMFLQNIILHKQVIEGDSRKDFTLRIEGRSIERQIPLYFSDKDELMELLGEDEDYVLALFGSLLEEWNNMCQRHYEDTSFLLTPMELFTTRPEYFMDRIGAFLDEDWRRSRRVRRALKQENIPRKLLTAGTSKGIYKRYGFKQIGQSGSTSVEQERILYKSYLVDACGIKKHSVAKLDELSKAYWDLVNRYCKVQQSHG